MATPLLAQRRRGVKREMAASRAGDSARGSRLPGQAERSLFTGPVSARSPRVVVAGPATTFQHWRTDHGWVTRSMWIGIARRAAEHGSPAAPHATAPMRLRPVWLVRAGRAGSHPASGAAPARDAGATCGGRRAASPRAFPRAGRTGSNAPDSSHRSASPRRNRSGPVARRHRPAAQRTPRRVRHPRAGHGRRSASSRRRSDTRAADGRWQRAGDQLAQRAGRSSRRQFGPTGTHAP